MPPKTKSSKKREVKPKKPKQKQKQKQKQQQNVKINVTQGGSGGGGGAPIIIPPQTPMQFRDTSGENVRLTGLIKDLENRIAGFRPRMEVKEPVVNPANDPITTRSVFNAPINNTDDLAEEVLREISQLKIKEKNPPVKIPAGFNEPITYNDSLGEQVQREETNAPRFEVRFVPETPKQNRRGRPKGSKNKPREPSNIPAQFDPTEADVSSSEFENARQRRMQDIRRGSDFPELSSPSEESGVEFV